MHGASPRSVAPHSAFWIVGTDIEWEYLPQVVPEIDADLAARYDAIYVNIARVPAAAVGACRLPPARHRAARRRLRHGRRRGDDQGRRDRDQHADGDAAAGGDYRIDVHLGARGQAFSQGPAHARRTAGTSAWTTWGAG